MATPAFLFPLFQMSVFLLLIFSANSIGFNFPSINQYTPGIQYENDASVTSEGIQLTRTQPNVNLGLGYSAGRAIYKEVVYLWDHESRNLTDFTTHFSFAVESETNFSGDGFAFFLAPNDSKIPPDSEGGFLGLTNTSNAYTREFPYVAVEFDNYMNFWDPPGDHFGINIDCIQSVNNVSVPPNTLRKGDVWISYNSSTRNLSVSMRYGNPISPLNFSLFHVVDLRDLLPPSVTVGFSAATGAAAQRHRILSWEFNSSLEMRKVETNGPFPNHPKTDRSRHKSKTRLIVVVISACALVTVLGLVWFVWRKSSRIGRQEDDAVFEQSMDDEFETGSGPKRFTYSELTRATNNFAEEGKLGQGGFGAVYKGFLSNLNLNVAVKRVSKGSKQGRKEYKSEVKIISRLRHKNLVQLLGWCHERGEYLLVYEFMPNGSLDSHLFPRKSSLSWGVRYKVVLGLGSALLYLHQEWEQYVVHRDIKSSNIMLDMNFNTKLGDFGLARLIDHEQGPKTTGLAGTFGYMAPEYITTGKASKESDVFSFGVVALEIACGRRAVEPQMEGSEVTLVAWVWELYGRESLLDAVDQRLHGDFDADQMECLMIVGLWCAHPDHNLRPSIRQAVQVLNFEAGIPDLPRTMPVASYHVPNPSISYTKPQLTFSSANVGR